MFSVTEAEAATICTAFEQEGELSAGIELRRLFQGSPTARTPGRWRGKLRGGAPYLHHDPRMNRRKGFADL